MSHASRRQDSPIIASEVFQEACSIFFLHCHNKPYCLIHPGTFQHKLQTQKIPDHLRLAIIASAVRYSSRSQWKDRKQKTIDSYAACSWELVMSLSGLGQDDISVIQTLALLAIIDATAGRQRAAWVKVGMAVRISQDLRMMLEPDSRLPYAERDERRNLFWSLYLLDRFICCSFHRPPAINDADCLLNLPTHHQPLTLKGLLSEQFEDPALQPGVFAITVAFSSVLGEIARYMMREDTLGLFDPQYTAFQSKLERLNEMTERNAGSDLHTMASTHLVLSRCLYHLSFCILKHPFLLGSLTSRMSHRESSKWMRDARHSCFAHASSLTQVLIDAQAAGSMPVPSFYSYSILVAGTVHALHLYGNDASASQQSLRYLENALQYLDRMSEFWDQANMISTVLRFFRNRCPRYSNILLRETPLLEDLTPTDLTVLRAIVDYWVMMDPNNPIAELTSVNIDCFPQFSQAAHEAGEETETVKLQQDMTHCANGNTEREFVDPQLLENLSIRPSPGAKGDPLWDWDDDTIHSA
ncbi:fungal-specific transcription factor domain-containing protein [Aspergillus floccosus]